MSLEAQRNKNIQWKNVAYQKQKNQVEITEKENFGTNKF
jgi:hypothetical protein